MPEGPDAAYVLVGEGATKQGLIAALQRALLAYCQYHNLRREQRPTIAVADFAEWLTADPLHLLHSPEETGEALWEGELAELAEEWSVDVAELKAIQRLLRRPYQFATLLYSIWHRLLYCEEQSSEYVPAQINVAVTYIWAEDQKPSRYLQLGTESRVSRNRYSPEEIQLLIDKGVLDEVPALPDDCLIRHQTAVLAQRLVYAVTQQGCQRLYEQSFPLEASHQEFCVDPADPPAAPPGAAHGGGERLHPGGGGGQVAGSDHAPQPSDDPGDRTDEPSRPSADGGDGADDA